MSIRAFPTIVAFTIMAALARQSEAMTAEVRLNAQNIAKQQVAVNIKVAEDGDYRNYTVTIEPKARKPLEYTLGRLCVNNGRDDIVEALLKEERTVGKLSYWCRVKRAYLKNSKFEFSENGGVVRTDSEGNRIVLGLPDGISYWFYLGDFPNGSAPNKLK